MAGYIGSKTSVTQVDGYNRTEADAEFVNDPNSVITVSGSNVGIGTTPSTDWRTAFNTTALQVGQSGCLFNLDVSNSDRRCMMTSNALLNTSGDFQHILEGPVTVYSQQGGTHRWSTAASAGSGATASANEAMRIDSSGNLLVGHTSSSSTAEGCELRNGNGSGYAMTVTNDGNTVVSLNRKTSDGDIALFRKDGSTVGSIGVAGSLTYIATNGGFGVGSGVAFSSSGVLPTTRTGDVIDNVFDIGSATYRWDDVYATNGTIQTSDRNEKQDIEALSDAEQRVAVACKGLLRKFRWIDAVAEKGDDARIHFGIIAQDLQDAFAAEGLDAGRYAMFISSTWWETQTEVPAVEAVAAVEATYDEDGNELTAAVEAVEAKEAYTRTDTYETLEEAPEGATERTRLGVRYPELLAFIIGAM